MQAHTAYSTTRRRHASRDAETCARTSHEGGRVETQTEEAMTVKKVIVILMIMAQRKTTHSLLTRKHIYIYMWGFQLTSLASDIGSHIRDLCAAFRAHTHSLGATAASRAPEAGEVPQATSNAPTTGTHTHTHTTDARTHALARTHARITHARTRTRDGVARERRRRLRRLVPQRGAGWRREEAERRVGRLKLKFQVKHQLAISKRRSRSREAQKRERCTPPKRE